jgi:hypothetical protein
MKRIVIVGILALLPGAVQAQQQTLVDGPIRSGGFGAPVLKFTEINEQFGFFVGGRGGWIINESLVLGGGGYGLTNQAHLAFDALEMGYGGLDLEYVNRPNELVHVSLAVLLGGGGATYFPSNSLAGFYSGFFVVEPAANIMLNVTPIFRIGVGASYRAVESLSLPELTNRDLSGFSGNIQFKFGMFTGR